MMTPIIHTEFAHWFEEDVVDVVSRFRLHGYVTNNLLVPHHVRELPNEHDIVILLEGRVVTVDAKALWPGTYRRGREGWEELIDDNQWAPSGFHGDPDRVGISKAKVMAGHVERMRRKFPAVASPEVISAIVVPDEADIGAMRDAPEVGRHYTINLRDLEALLESDMRRQRRSRPTPDELLTLMEIPRQPAVPTLPISIGDIELSQRLATLDAPFRRALFTGTELPVRSARLTDPTIASRSLPGRKLMIEVCERTTRDVRRTHIDRGFVANYHALCNLDGAGILRFLFRRESPVAITCVYEHFSDSSLRSILERGETLAWRDARRVFHEMFEALHLAHSKQIFHRLLEPDYILIDLTRSKHCARMFGFWGAKVIELLTTGIAAPASPYRLDSATGGEDLALRDMYALNRCLIASLSGNPARLPPPTEVPEPALAAMMLMNSPDQATRRTAWPVLRKALRG